ncbi:MAG: hypothetical protein A2289_10480 [Deltaproteobacteria bacterium RIFOXYA12_FULL_58_15]|nr:MAG: hypothetical protein A2289_10480 [Deltaproteobacteria bacterium RIFOXYA12_FULL_58_15]OGR15062.1 MAG: hypothetical protein A2341_05685 [Deltaproteobacteria bacterium RIFOXYB12_FULL_58_9]
MSKSFAYRLRDVVHRYDHRVVVNVAKLDLSAAACHVLLGANGAGKSTLLTILALLEGPSEGRVELLGRNVENHHGGSVSRRDVTLVHQKPVLFSTTVFANVAFGLLARKMSRPEVKDRVHRAMKQVGLGGFEHRSGRQLSGGEVQRIAIARALVLETPILLLDEPTSFLVAGFVPTLVRLLRRRVEDGATVIIATQDEEFATRIADDTILIDDGVVTENL